MAATMGSTAGVRVAQEGIQRNLECEKEPRKRLEDLLSGRGSEPRRGREELSPGDEQPPASLDTLGSGELQRIQTLARMIHEKYEGGSPPHSD
jgi:hypothetical protein